MLGQVLISPLIGMWPRGGKCFKKLYVGFDGAGEVKSLKVAREESDR
jgi:hypothetical protein